jgi:hypothetical protein
MVKRTGHPGLEHLFMVNETPVPRKWGAFHDETDLQPGEGGPFHGERHPSTEEMGCFL